MNNGERKSGKYKGISKALKASKQAKFGLFTRSINIEEAKIVKPNKYVPSLNQSFDMSHTESAKNLPISSN